MINLQMTRTPNFNLNLRLSSAVFRQVGLDIRKFIIDRTKKGVDINNKQFAEYAPATIEYRKRMGKTTDIVNLEDRSEMHNALQVKESPKDALIYYVDRNRANVALKHQQGSYNLPQRIHFGLTPTSARQFINKLKAKLLEQVKRQIR